MKLPRIAIANYQFVLILVFLACSMGLLSFFTMPRSEDPTLDFPTYIVTAIYPGTSPVDMEELVVDPLEEAINEVENIDKLRTTIQDGLAVIRIEGPYGVDTDKQLDEVQRKVSEVRGDLPAELYDLDVRQATPLDVKILQMALVSDHASYGDLLDQAEVLERRLAKIDGIRNVKIEGYPEEEIHVDLDFDKMAQSNLSLSQVLGVLRSNQANIPGGEIDMGTARFSVKGSGSYTSVEQLRQTVVGGSGGQMIRLGDIAQVYTGYARDRYIARYNGRRALFVSATQQAGYNILAIDEKMEQVLATFRSELPQHIELAYAFRQAPAVAARVNDFFANLLQGILLVGGVILIFLGIRNSLIITTFIPSAIIIAIGLLDLAGYGLQQISIAGLVLALGLLVDNGIVVVENIQRFLREGHSPFDAAVKGTAEVGWPIVSSTVTTVLAFFPMTQLGGGTGEFIRTLPLTVIFSLGASMVLALVLSPLLASKLLKPVVVERLRVTDRWLKRFVEGFYRRSLHVALDRPLMVVLIALLTLGGSMALFPLVGVSFFPAADKPLLLVNIDLPDGSNLDRSDAAARYVESVLDSMPDVRSYVSNVGHGNPQIYYNVIPQNYRAEHAQVLVHLTSWRATSFPRTIAYLRSRFETYPGARITVEELKNGPPNEAPIAIKVIGDELEEIARLSGEVERIIASTDGTVNVDNPLAVSRTQLWANIQRDKAGMAGVALLDIDQALRTSVTGQELGTVTTADGKKYPLIARLAVDEPRLSDFSRVYLGSMSGAQVPLRQIVQFELTSGAARIDHFELQRTGTITAGAIDGYNVAALTEQIVGRLDAMNWPSGYSYYVAGEYETQQESFGDLGQQLLIAVLGIFAVLILQFQSIRQPFIVLSAVPLAISGSVVALFLSGYSFSFLAFVGFTSLVGIVVNTSIILVDYTNQLLARGLPLREAIVQASETRFTPIMLTTLTTICGLLPLTLSGSNLWAPLGWTIIGGIVSSTILTLLMVPILYQWLTPPSKVQEA
ncbi:MAG: efflux RND transporter permease subunit [Bacteroidia bacterium]